LEALHKIEISLNDSDNQMEVEGRFIIRQKIAGIIELSKWRRQYERLWID